MDISFATMGAGVLHLVPLQQLPATLKAAAAGGSSSSSGLPDRPASAPSSGGTTGPTCSLAAVNKLIEGYAGPLGPNSSKDKCIRFIKERLANCQAEECGPDTPAWQVEGKRALWELLLLMAKNQGQLKASSGSGSSSGKSAAAAVGGLLQKAVGAAAGAVGDGGGGVDSSGPTPSSAAASPTAAAAAGSAAAADCELLKVLAPGAASAATAGQRVLAAQVPEVELQATAAEMQVGDQGSGGRVQDCSYWSTLCVLS